MNGPIDLKMQLACSIAKEAEEHRAAMAQELSIARATLARMAEKLAFALAERTEDAEELRRRRKRIEFLADQSDRLKARNAELEATVARQAKLIGITPVSALYINGRDPFALR